MVFILIKFKILFSKNRFWDAVQELKCVHTKDVSSKVQEIWNEYLGPGKIETK